MDAELHWFLLRLRSWRCNMLIYRKKNQTNPACLFQQKDVCPKYYDLLFFIIVSRSYQRICARGPHTGCYVTSHSLKHVLGCSMTTGMFYVFHIYLLSLLRKTSAVCVLFPWDCICFGFLILLHGEPNLFYKQTLFYIPETCVLTFRPRPFIYFLIQFPLWVTLFS